MKRRGPILVTIGCFVLWVIGLALYATFAKGADSQTLASETSEWIGETLHAPVLERTLVVRPDLPREFAGGVYCERPREVALQPSIVRAWTLAARRGFVAYPDEVLIVLHELLHRGPEVCSYDPYIEEGITQAMALDLLPSWGMRFLGQKLTMPNRGGAYAEQVTYLRHLSAVRTGSSWRSYAARQWRRALYLSDRATRQEMVTPTTGGTE